MAAVVAVLESPQLGSIVFDPGQVIRFPAGLPAFEHETEFLLVEREATAPVVFLQSVLTPDLAFITLPVAALAPDYPLALSPEDNLALGGEPDPASLLTLAIVTVGQSRRPTANLMAPVVIDTARRCGAQLLQPASGYSHVHELPAPCS